MKATQVPQESRPVCEFKPGHCLRDFEYQTLEGVHKRLTDFKGRKNLVMILAGLNDHTFLNEAARAYPQIRDLEAEVIVILGGAPRPRKMEPWPFDVTVDSTGALHRRFGAADDQGTPGLAVYVTDRWAEVVYASLALQGDPPPRIGDLIEWLKAVEYECPECFPPESRA